MMNKQSCVSSKSEFRLVCISEDHTTVAGGVPAVVDQLSNRVADNHIPVNLIHAKCGGFLPHEGVVTDCIKPSSLLGSKWNWSRELRYEIERTLLYPEPAVFHIHGIWSAPQYYGAKVAKEMSIPFIVSAHGMLEPWLWENQGWKVRSKKKVYWKLFAYPVLSKANVIHAITPLERQHLHSLFPKNRIEVIPNAIDLNKYPEEDFVSKQRNHTILFVGRIEPKKGVDILLKAFVTAKISKKWRLVIIGPVWATNYQQQLKKIVKHYGFEDRVSILGPILGDEKLKWIRKAWIMAVPSHSEVVGLVNLEAASLYTPSITTYETGLYDWEDGGGLLIHPEISQMRLALENACSWSVREREERGAACRFLVEQRYSWKSILPQWMSLYKSMV